MEAKWHMQVGEHAVILSLCRPELRPGLGNIGFSWVCATEGSVCKTEINWNILFFLFQRSYKGEEH